MTRTKLKRRILGAVAGISITLMIGSVGALERETVSFRQGALQAFIFLAIFAISTYLLRKEEVPSTAATVTEHTNNKSIFSITN